MTMMRMMSRHNYVPPYILASSDHPLIPNVTIWHKWLKECFMVMMMSCTDNHHLPLGGSLTHNSWSLLRPSINSRLGGTCFCKSRSCKLYWCGWWYIMVLQWFGWRLYWYSMVLVIVIWYTIPYMVYYTRYSDLLLHITPADSVDDIVWYSIWYMV